VLAVDAGQAAFADQAVGVTSAPLDVVFTNRGGSPLDLVGAAVGQDLPGGTAYPGDYRIVTDGCAARSLGGGDSCVVTVVHTPGGVGRRDALLAVTSRDGQSAAVLLTGTGIASGVTVSPAVTRPGRVVRVIGTALSRDTAVTVVLRPAGLPVAAMTDGAGGFAVAYPVERNAAVGRFAVDVVGAGGQVLATGTLLIVRPSAEPPGFANR
jgi:hypothetical protein